MTNQLLNYRLAHLRAIAKAWNDTDFETKLLETEDLLSSDDPEIKELFGDLRLGNVSIGMIDNPENPAKWHPEAAAGWIGPNDYFVINLPAAPEVTEQAQALAAYYELFPSLFGTYELKDGETAADGLFPLNLGIDHNPEPFFEFGEITTRAIALAWSDPKFLKELTDSDLADATPILSKYMAFNNPWNFNIQFYYNDDFRWNGDGWSKPLPKNKIKLRYPHRPENVSYQAIALTSYNATGPEYPFTCI